MTNEEAKKMLKAKLDCLTYETAGCNYDCNNHLCDGCNLNYRQGNMGEQIEALDMAIKALEQQPKTGKWIEEDVFDGELVYRCSECGEPFWLENGTPKDNEYNFCPKCGAKMAESEGSLDP